MESEFLSVLSLNCWGLYLVSKQRQFRLHAIADAISVADYDIVTLQEIWVAEDFAFLKSRVATDLPHARYFYSGAMGSGLAILSRYPIVSTSFVRYTLAGRPLKIFHGDYYVGKGCASACIDHPTLGVLEVFTTHLHAGYGTVDEYEGHRVTESWELAKLLRRSAAQGRQVIATGDFNSIPTSYSYQLLKDHAFMSDSWLDANGHRIDEPPEDPFERIQHGGITCNSPLNIWSKNSSSDPGDRLDYVFYRRTPELQCVTSRVVLTEPIAGTSMSFSDHYGVHSTFAIHAGGSGPFAPPASALTHPAHSRISRVKVYDIYELLQRDRIATNQTGRRLVVLSVFCAMLVIVQCAGVVAVPTLLYTGWLATTLLFIGGISTILLSSIATVCAIVGCVFGWAEQQSLVQFSSDIHTLLVALDNQAREAE